MNSIQQYAEMIRLADMLAAAGIPFDMYRCHDGWQLLYSPKGMKPVSVIEHAYSYGGRDDRLELDGLLTKAEKKVDAVVGYMTAEEVFERIRKHWRDAEDGQGKTAGVPSN